jgi:hypothetical protein
MQTVYCGVVGAPGPIPRSDRTPISADVAARSAAFLDDALPELFAKNQRHHEGHEEREGFTGVRYLMLHALREPPPVKTGNLVT